MIHCLQDDEEWFRVSGNIKEVEHSVFFENVNRKRKFFVNNRENTPFEFLAGKNIIYFSPEETQQFFMGNEIRRNLVDRYLVAMDPDFLYVLMEYQKFKKEKHNILFSETREKKELLNIHNSRMIEISMRISKRRKDIIRKISEENLPDILDKLNPSCLETIIEYNEHSFPEDGYEKEIEKKKILFGCQKDEYHFIQKGKNARFIFSNGQKKVLNLAFHFAFLENFFQRKIDTLVCLDDYESEMDEFIIKRVEKMIENMETQCICTTKRKRLQQNSYILL